MMRNNKSIILLILVGMLLPSCNNELPVKTTPISLNEIETKAQDIYPTVDYHTPMPTVYKFTPRQLHNITPLPTPKAICLVNETEKSNCIRKLIERNYECGLPCLFGITTGATPFEEAMRYLINSGMKLQSRSWLEFGNDSYLSYQLDEMYLSIELFGFESVLGLETTYYETDPKYIMKYNSLIMNITPSAIMKTMGLPDVIALELLPFTEEEEASEYRLWTIYDNRILVFYSGYAKKIGEGYEICTSTYDTYHYINFVHLLIIAPDIERNIIEMDYSGQIYVPEIINNFSEMTHINNETLYKELLKNNRYCFIAKNS